MVSEIGLYNIAQYLRRTSI